MQKKLFYDNPYCKEFVSTVVSCEQGKKGYEIVLEETAFYPEGGGQPADMGWLENTKVLDVRERDGMIVHICEEPLPVAARVAGKLDWERRFRHMQQHTGEHIFSGLIHKHFGYNNIGFHMGKGFTTVDFDGLLNEEEMRMIETEANQVIFENREVYAGYPSKKVLEGLSYRSKKELQGAIRIVEVPDADMCACCGTHVSRTGEIGIIKVTGNEKYKGGSRIFLQIGWQALEDYRQKTERVQKITGLLSSKPELIDIAVEKLQQSYSEQRLQLSQLKKELLQYKAGALQSENKKLCVEAQNMDAVEIRMLCDMLLAKNELVLVFTGEEQTGYKFVLGKKEGLIEETGKEFREACNAKGGGKDNMMQGSAACTKEQIIAFAKQNWQMETAFSI